MTKSIPADAVSAAIIPIVFGFNNVYDNMEVPITFHSKEAEDPENFPVLEIEYADVSGGCLITTATYGSEKSVKQLVRIDKKNAQKIYDAVLDCVEDPFKTVMVLTNSHFTECA